jgi:glycosyltransferase involved in cell wall biosynthesis
MTATPRISYLLPVYNEEETIASTARAVTEHLTGLWGGEVLLLENGSTDRSPAIVDCLAEELTRPGVTVVAVHVAKGFGNAIRRGLEMATGDLVVVTAADLPFRFSDLAEVLACDPLPVLAIGSKAHARSKISVSAKRSLMSRGYRLARRLFIGLNVGDSQGSLFLEGGLARSVCPHLNASDFFLSTEIVAVASRLGAQPIELPVDYQTPRPGSTVRPLHDGTAMLLALFGLRRRLRLLPPGAAA